MSEATTETTAETTTGPPAANVPTESTAGKTFTQADLDRVVADRVARERKKYEGHDDFKAQAAELATLRESQKSEMQKLADQKATAERQASEAQAAAQAANTELLRYRVAAKAKLSPELAERLKGGTEEELLADAKELLKLVGPQGPPDFDGGARKTAKTNDMNQVIRQAAGLA